MPSYLATGAARGIGAANDRLAKDSVTNVHILQGNITDVASSEKAATEASEILGDEGLDVLINKAAYVSDITALRTLDEDDDNLQFIADDVIKSFNTNIVGVLNAINKFLPLVKMGKKKKSVAISSDMGDIDFINAAHISIAAPYAVSKAALSTLVAKINVSNESQGIFVISICPGFVDTAPPDYAPSEDDIAQLQKIAAKFSAYSLDLRGQLTPEESAKSVLAAIDRSSLEKGSGWDILEP